MSPDKLKQTDAHYLRAVVEMRDVSYGASKNRATEDPLVRLFANKCWRLIAVNENVPSVKGHCRCGRIEFEVSTKPLITMACHCTGCQRMTSSAFSLSSLFPSAGFSITSGEPVVGGIHGSTRHYFCAYCMSWLFTRPEGTDDFVNIRSVMLEDSPRYKPFIETYVDEKLEWATTGSKHSFDKFPPQEQFPQLLQEYARRND